MLAATISVAVVVFRLIPVNCGDAVVVAAGVELVIDCDHIDNCRAIFCSWLMTSETPPDVSSAAIYPTLPAGAYLNFKRPSRQNESRSLDCTVIDIMRPLNRTGI